MTMQIEEKKGDNIQEWTSLLLPSVRVYLTIDMDGKWLLDSFSTSPPRVTKLLLMMICDRKLGIPFQYLLHRGVGEDATPFAWLLHFTLETYLIMLSVKQRGIKNHFLSLWYDSSWDWTPLNIFISFCILSFDLILFSTFEKVLNLKISWI